MKTNYRRRPPPPRRPTSRLSTTRRGTKRIMSTWQSARCPIFTAAMAFMPRAYISTPRSCLTGAGPAGQLDRRILAPGETTLSGTARPRGGETCRRTREGQSFRGRPHPKRPARRGCDPGSGFAAAGGNRPAYRSTHCGLAELLRCGQPLLLAPVAPPALHAADVAAARRVGRPEVDAMCSRLPPVFGMGQLPAFQSSCPRYPFVDVGPAGPWRARWRVGS